VGDVASPLSTSDLTTYDTPPIATKRAIQAMASAGEGREKRMRFFTRKSLSVGESENRRG